MSGSGDPRQYNGVSFEELAPTYVIGRFLEELDDTSRTSNSAGTKMADLFFGGVSNLKRLLSEAIHRRRCEHGMSAQHLDSLCGFGDAVPTTADVEADAGLLSVEFVTRSAFALDLALDDVLKLDMGNPKTRDLVVREMREAGAGIVSA